MKVSQSYSSFSNARKYYEILVADNKLLPLKEFEDLNKYFGKKGKPLKSKLRSEKAKQEFNKALKAYNKRFGTGGKKRLEKEVRAQEEKLEKQFTKNFPERTKKTTRFQALAKSEMIKRKQAVLAFTSESTKALRDKLNVGSGTIQYLAVEKGYTQKMIDRYLENLNREYDLLSPTAKKLADVDTLNKAIRDLSDYYGDNMSDALAGYLYGVDIGREDETLQAIHFYTQAKEEYGDRIDFNKYTIEDFIKEFDENYYYWETKNFEELMESKTESEEN